MAGEPYDSGSELYDFDTGTLTSVNLNRHLCGAKPLMGLPEQHLSHQYAIGRGMLTLYFCVVN